MTAEAFVAAMAKHLPPSASSLRLLDIDGRCGQSLRQLRADLDITACRAADLTSARYAESSFDAIAALDADLSDAILATALQLLRPGGRFIAVESNATVDETRVIQLESRGYTRILVEAAHDNCGLLLRGERPHITADTQERIRGAADADADRLDLSTYRRPYLHLLIRQSPDKPVWQLSTDERVSWHALALHQRNATVILAFSSLPKAVAFMQPIALDGAALNINKVGKFTRETAAAWDHPVRLNLTTESIRLDQVTWLPVDPATAAAPDE